MSNAELMKTIAIWSRARGIPKPTTPDGMKALIAQFFAEHEHVHQAQAPGWQEMNDPPIHVGVNGAGVQVLDPSDPEGDDWDEMMHDRSAAMAQGGGDDLARDAILGQREQAALTEQKPLGINPPSAQAGVLGQAVLVTAGSQPVTLAYWVGPDAHTMPVTVTVGVPPGSPVGSNQGGTVNPFRGFATIQWGTRATLQSADVDIGTGFQLSVNASMVTLLVTLPLIAGQVAQTTLLSGMLSFRPPIRTAPVTRTVYIAAGQSLIPVVPPFAKSVIFYANDATVQTILKFNTLQQREYSYTILANAFMVDPIPLSGDIIGVEATSAGGTPAGRMIFQLGI